MIELVGAAKDCLRLTYVSPQGTALAVCIVLIPGYYALACSLTFVPWVVRTRLLLAYVYPSAHFLVSVCTFLIA